MGSNFLVLPQFPVDCDGKILQRDKRLFAEISEVFNRSFFFLLKPPTLDKLLCPSSNSLSLPLPLVSPAAPFLCSPRERKPT